MEDFSFEKFISNAVALLIYSIIGAFSLSIAGLSANQCVGFGLIFGFVIGILNEILRDFTEIKHKL